MRPPPPAPPSKAELDTTKNLRVGAALVDLVLVVLVGAVVASALGITFRNPSGGVSLAPYLVINAVSIVYFVIAEAAWGRSLGKLVTGLRVVRADGSPLRLVDALIRNILRPVDGLFVYLVGLIAIMCTARAQRIGDLAAHTLVVRA
jgi:uncharacterized RDD family membrane protein YckC